MAWYAKPTGSYDINSDEALANATEIYNILSERGWTVNAICGALGNMQGAESGLNPWRWYADNVQASTGSPWSDSAYGLVQFHYPSKYIDSDLAKSLTGYAPNFSDKSGNALDGQAQTIFIHETLSDQYSSHDSYPLTANEYITSTLNVTYLAEVWAYNYEKASDKEIQDSLSKRTSAASHFYDKLSGETPTPTPPTPTPTDTHKMKWIFYMGRRWVL